MALISCIIPVFNGERYLHETLDSILAQTYRPLEILLPTMAQQTAQRSLSPLTGTRFNIYINVMAERHRPVTWD
jgi:GT2 family glycosyltransferase